MTSQEMPQVESTEMVALFPTLVWKVQLKPETYAPLNTQIKAKLEALARATPDLPAHGKWQTGQRLHTLPEFQPLNAIIYAAATGVLDYLKVVRGALEITGCWANMSPRGDGHKPHTHPNNYFSGVYYVQTQEGANRITFDDPRPQTNIICPVTTEATDENAGQIHVNVHEGMMVLFPSWLQHHVPPNESDRMRISIAFNVMFSLFAEQMSRPKWTGNIDVT